MQLHDKLAHRTELTEPPLQGDSGSCLWVKVRVTPSINLYNLMCFVQTRKLLLLAENCLRRGEHVKSLQFLTKAPDLRPLFHAPEAKTILLVRHDHLYMMLVTFIDMLLPGIWLGYL